MLALAGLFAFRAGQSLDLKWDIGFALLTFVVLLRTFEIVAFGDCLRERDALRLIGC